MSLKEKELWVLFTLHISLVEADSHQWGGGMGGVLSPELSLALLPACAQLVHRLQVLASSNVQLKAVQHLVEECLHPITHPHTGGLLQIRSSGLSVL